MEEKIYKGWDVYGDYCYDEVKVIAMLHKELMDRKWYPDWEEVMKVGHTIYHIWDSQVDENALIPVEKWQEVRNYEESAYVQAWFARTKNNFLEWYKNILEVY